MRDNTILNDNELLEYIKNDGRINNLVRLLKDKKISNTYIIKILRIIINSNLMVFTSFNMFYDSIVGLIEYGFSIDEVIAIAEKNPLVLKNSKTVNLNGIKNVESYGYTFEEIKKIFLFNPRFFKSKNLADKIICFYLGIGLRSVVLNVPMELSQNFDFISSRLKFYNNNNIVINDDTYYLLFIDEKEFFNRYGVFTSRLIKDYVDAKRKTK